MTNYSIDVTNAGNINNQSELKRKNISIKCDCKITNYDTKTNDGKAKGLITINLVNGQETIKRGQGDKLSGNLGTADFKKDVYSVFTAIAALDGNESDLSMNDILKIDTIDKNEYGINSIIKDFKLGVAKIVLKSSRVLQIDFVTPEEAKSVSNTTQSQEAGTTNSSSNQKSDFRCVYTINDGDCIYNIKTKYGVTEKQILDANPNLKKVKKNNGTFDIWIEVDGNLRPLRENDKLNIPWPKKPERVLNLSNINQEARKFLAAVCQKESSGNYSITSRDNDQGYLGLYQMGEKALKDIGVYNGDKTSENDWIGTFKKNKFDITSKSDFLSSPEKQHQAIIAYCRVNWKNLLFECEQANINLESYIGKTINGVKITKSGLLAGAHLVGVGKVVKFLTSKDPKELEKIKDENGTHVSEYMTKFAGYDISDFTKEIV